MDLLEESHNERVFRDYSNRNNLQDRGEHVCLSLTVSIVKRSFLMLACSALQSFACSLAVLHRVPLFSKAIGRHNTLLDII